MGSNLLGPPQMPFIVDGFRSTWEVAPEGNVKFMPGLSKRYRKELKTGAKYELVWPGGEIAIWDWGTINQYLGHELGIKSPKICLPAARVTLEFTEPGKEEERQDSPPQISPSERMQVLLCTACSSWLTLLQPRDTETERCPRVRKDCTSRYPRSGENQRDI